jgi:hypothetical protein
MKTKFTLCWLTFAFLIEACSRPGSAAGSSAVKPIDQAALQTSVPTGRNLRGMAIFQGNVATARQQFAVSIN